MVYSQDFLDSTLDNINDITAMSVPGRTPPTVQVIYNNTGLHTVGGPTPFVDISMSVENNSIGIPESATTKITLTGKIVRPAETTPTGSGIQHVLSGIKLLNQLFEPDKFASFEIKCNGTDIYSVTGVKTVSIDIGKTSDNWVQTADYTVILEGYKSYIKNYSVKNLSDSWSIEPLEDYTYSNFVISNISQKGEYDNPNMKPTAPSTASLQPGASQSTTTSDGASFNGMSTLNVVSIPQFKVTHSVSAVGIPSGTGNITGLMNSTYLNARKWVEDRLDLSSTASPATGIIALTSSSGPHLATGYLYNHIRSSNFSIIEGKYEVTDNWIAMPTGIVFVEDYSIDMTTDDKYIHTVSVKGEVRGLSLGGDFSKTHSHMNTGNPSKIQIPNGTGYTGTLAGNTFLVPDVGTSSAITTIKNNKYENAISGWIHDVKPYLYRRACVAMSTSDRTKGYIVGRDKPPNNPVYSKHGLLNIVPVSTSESHNTRKGTISYSYDFNNKFTIISGVISESISIDDTGPTDVIGEAFVLGRALGPVLQNLGSKTSAKKSISIEVTVVPPSSLKGFFLQNSDCPLFTGGVVYKTISGIIEGLKPFGDRPTSFFGTSSVQRSVTVNDSGQVYVSQDNQTWDPTNGRFTRTVVWTHQQCNNNRHWLNH